MRGISGSICDDDGLCIHDEFVIDWPYCAQNLMKDEDIPIHVSIGSIQERFRNGFINGWIKRKQKKSKRLRKRTRTDEEYKNMVQTLMKIR